MKLTEFEDKSIRLTPVSAMGEYFIWYLAALIKAKEVETLREISSRLPSLSQSPQPLP